MLILFFLQAGPPPLYLSSIKRSAPGIVRQALAQGGRAPSSYRSSSEVTRLSISTQVTNRCHSAGRDLFFGRPNIFEQIKHEQYLFEKMQLLLVEQEKMRKKTLSLRPDIPQDTEVKKIISPDMEAGLEQVSALEEERLENEIKCFLVLHGFAQDSEDFIPVVNALKQSFPGALCPPLSGSFNISIRRLIDHCNAWFPIPDIHRIVHEEMVEWLVVLFPLINKYTNYVVEKAKIQKKNIRLLGFSQGGTVLLDLFRKDPELKYAVVCGARFHPTMPIQKDELAGFGKKVLLLSGKDDKVVTPDCMKKVKEQLEELGVEVELYMYEGGHEVTEEAKEMAIKFFRYGSIDLASATPDDFSTPLNAEDSESVSDDDSASISSTRAVCGDYSARIADLK